MAGSNGNKRAIQLEDGQIYMLKFPPISKNNEKISYSNSCISEYISCQIIKSMGIEVQDTILGKAMVEGKEKIVVACKDFTQNGEKLYEFAMIKNGCIGSSNNGYGTELKTVLSAIEEQNIYNSEELKRYFRDLFIIDETPYISETRKEFYKIMIQKRYENIIKYSYEKLCK